MSSVKPFQRFLDDHAPDVHRFLVAAVGRQEADDVFQETFLSALRSYPREPVRNERAWVLTIAHRKALDHFRARGRRAVPVAELPETPVVDGHPVFEEPTWDAVRALPPKQRASVLLRYAGSLTNAEVAAALRISEDAVRRNVFEGLRKLSVEVTP